MALVTGAIKVIGIIQSRLWMRGLQPRSDTSEAGRELASEGTAPDQGPLLIQRRVLELRPMLLDQSQKGAFRNA